MGIGKTIVIIDPKIKQYFIVVIWFLIFLVCAKIIPAVTVRSAIMPLTIPTCMGEKLNKSIFIFSGKTISPALKKLIAIPANITTFKIGIDSKYLTPFFISI